MTLHEFFALLKKEFPFEVTKEQEITLEQLTNFIFSTKSEEVFLLKGYAGTGKTTLIATIVNNLWKIKKSAVLLAPTGRAAKVIANYSKKEAFTIHKKIYTARYSKNGKVDFTTESSHCRQLEGDGRRCC